MTARRVFWGWMVCLAGGPGCTAESVGGAPDLDATVDAATIDARASEDAGRRDAAPARGRFGEPCRENADCASNYCVEAADFGRICTDTCGECPAGFECRPVANAGPDRLFLCLADQPDLCKPCDNDRECDDNEDLCLSFGRNAYCGEDCADDGVCPAGYECVDVEDADARQCVPAGGASCQPCTDLDGDGYGDGADCLGFDCDDDDPTVYRGADELCDGKDNDCNALVDDAPSGAPAGGCPTEGVCAAVTLACVGGAWTCPFPATYEPDAETRCDGFDNDCDGVTDEALLGTVDHCARCGDRCAFPNAEARCDAVEGCGIGACNEGFHDADGVPGNGCEYACDVTLDGVEGCDTIDNDCDGRVDEGTGGAEVCNGADDDCDGTADEGFDLQADGANCGACGVSCAADGAETACEAGDCVLVACAAGRVDLDGDRANGCEYRCAPTNGGVEACDATDNDCDGEVDEGYDLQTDGRNCGACGERCLFPNAAPACAAGQCVVEDCTPGFVDLDGQRDNGCEYPCQPGNGGVEACNGADDDCDGRTDEGYDLLSDATHCGVCGRACVTPDATPRCDAGDCRVGECAPGFHDLDGFAENGCEYACFPTNAGVEACDGVDNDCDGVVDDGYDLQADPAHCGRCGNACARPMAQWICDAGRCAFQGCDAGFVDLDGAPETGCEYACVPSGDEVCDGDDDDCDGALDEGTLNACGACGPTPDEVCNGADDDCDGRTDEGVLNACGACGAVPAETCNGVDDDCNGATDDHGVCGPFVQARCRLFVGWADEERGPDGAVPTWSTCPGADRQTGGDVRCAGTRRDGRFAKLDLFGDVNGDDEVAVAFYCDDAAQPDLAAWIQSHCAVFLGHADNDRGPDRSNVWGPCPAAASGDDGNLRCTSSGYDGRWRQVDLVGDVDESDDWGVAFICRDPADPARAAAMQASAEVFLGWADNNRGPADGSATWATCPANSGGEANLQRCVGSQGDGLFHRMKLRGIAGDVDGNDDFGFALRARPAP